MLPYNVIAKKRDGYTLDKEELEYFVNGYVKGDIKDYQAAALLMAIFLKGMTDKETADLTMIMVNSGETIDLSPIKGIKVDKHSTGGVGDTTTLVLAPLVAAAGVPMAKMSGRGLGHTGGTLDKLESIPGFRIDLSREEFIDQVNRIGISIIGQTANLVPADKKMYALRDVTATVNSIPLIAGSIMSKKIAAGTDAIVLDVKVGSGAFIPEVEDAKKLARIMVNIGSLVNRKVRAILTNMDEPLGSYIGNALEVKEAIEILSGEHKGSPLYEVSLTLASHLVHLGGVAEDEEKGRTLVEDLLIKGKGLEKFQELIEAQGGDPKVALDTSLLPQASREVEILSRKAGFVTAFDTKKIGMAALILGAGRVKKGDPIDPAVGIVIKKRIGDEVEKGEPLATIYGNDDDKIMQASEKFLESITIKTEEPKPIDLVIDTITHDKLIMTL